LRFYGHALYLARQVEMRGYQKQRRVRVEARLVAQAASCIRAVRFGFVGGVVQGEEWKLTLTQELLSVPERFESGLSFWNAGNGFPMTD